MAWVGQRYVLTVEELERDYYGLGVYLDAETNKAIYYDNGVPYYHEYFNMTHRALEQAEAFNDDDVPGIGIQVRRQMFELIDDHEDPGCRFDGWYTESCPGRYFLSLRAGVAGSYRSRYFDPNRDRQIREQLGNEAERIRLEFGIASVENLRQEGLI